MNTTVKDFDIAEHFHNGIWGAEHTIRLNEIGIELYKVHKYANKMNTDADLFSQIIVNLTRSSYFAGCVPIIRIESALFLAKDFRNEYAYALSARAYLEVAGRLHKGLRLWQQYVSKKKTLEEFRDGVERLLAKFRPKYPAPSDIFEVKGFNVMTLVESINDKIPNVIDTYEILSSYAHGGFQEQMYFRNISWLSDVKQDHNPVIDTFEKVAEQLRAMVFEDFKELLRITKQIRDRYDNMVISEDK